MFVCVCTRARLCDPCFCMVISHSNVQHGFVSSSLYVRDNNLPSLTHTYPTLYTSASILSTIRQSLPRQSESHSFAHSCAHTCFLLPHPCSLLCEIFHRARHFSKFLRQILRPMRFSISHHLGEQCQKRHFSTSVVPPAFHLVLLGRKTELQRRKLQQTKTVSRSELCIGSFFKRKMV